jgi:hypothetical protein
MRVTSCKLDMALKQDYDRRFNNSETLTLHIIQQKRINYLGDVIPHLTPQHILQDRKTTQL